MTDERPDENLLRDARELTLISAGAGGQPQETPLRFVYRDGVVCLLATTGADWYRNIERDHGVVVRVGRRGFRGRAKVYEARQRAKMIDEVVALFRKKYGAKGIAEPEKGTLLPVTIDVQF
ncbi:MAG TPA: nitroreductase/quinone reductase family protein [Anaerolineae bacterium]